MDSDKQQELDKAFNKAKIRLMAKPDSVFFASLCFSLKHKFSDDLPTAGTDGKEVLYNPDFFIKLTPDQQVFLILHETLHCAYMHMFRAKQLNMDRHKANVAADHVINLQLLERGFVMPPNGLADPQYKGMSMEQIYALLPDDVMPPMDDLLDGLEGEEMEDAIQEIQDTLVRAAMQSKMAGDKAGTIPGEIEIFLNGLLNPKLPWQTILRRYLNKFKKKGFDWKKPNRRFFPDPYLPSRRSKNLMEIAIAVDTSGSVTDDQFHQFITEVHAIFKMMAPPKITLIQFDSQLQAVDEVKTIKDLMRVKFSGRGGTWIDPVFEWAEEHKPQLLLVFTDGEFTNPTTNMPPETIWLIHDNPNWKSPFGTVIHYAL